jgi:hypothetical protein
MTIHKIIEANPSEYLIVETGEFRGRVYAFLRTHYVDNRGNLKQTGRLIAARPTVLDELIEALLEAKAELARRAPGGAA